MNRNMVLFVVLSLATFMGWAWVMKRIYPHTEAPAKALPGAVAKALPQGSQAAASNPQAAALPASALAVRPAKENRVTVKTASLEATFSSLGAEIVSWKLLPYKEHKDMPQPVELIPVSKTGYAALEGLGAGLEGANWTLETLQPRKLKDGIQEVSFATGLPGTPLKLRKTFAIDPERFLATLRLEINNPSATGFSVSKGALLWGPNLGAPDQSQQGQASLAGVVHLQAKIERERAGDSKTFGYVAPKWVALKSHYFVAAFVPSEGWDWAEIRRKKEKDKVPHISVALGFPEFTLKAGEKKQLETQLYVGPQIYETLKSLGHNLQSVIQFQFWSFFDWLNPLCLGMLKILRWFHAVTGNWGLAIILLTALVRGALFYPSQKTMVSMRRMQTKMAAMQPRLDTLKKTYKDDPQKMNAEMMKLYKEYGVNPLGGCLPMLIQIPIFFALYGTLMAAFEIRGAPFFWKWDDLSGPDPTYIFSLFMGATMFLQQKMSPSSASATASEEQQQMQKMMLYIMPVMFTVMSVMFKWPTGLLLYWSVSNVFAISQQWYVNKTVK